MTASEPLKKLRESVNQLSKLGYVREPRITTEVTYLLSVGQRYDFYLGSIMEDEKQHTDVKRKAQVGKTYKVKY
ncbi:MAG: hypothetical protein ACRBFS_17915 [Aureispira sp.]